MMSELIIWFEDLKMDDVERVGGKNASLGEMISSLAGSGVDVPGGFATTAYAFRQFAQHNRLDQRIDEVLSGLNVDDVKALAKAGAMIRQWVIETPFPKNLDDAISEAYDKMLKRYGDDFTVAVRSSATAEDLPDASFAGQQETFLNVHGIDQVTLKIKEVFASLYNDRAISYRVHQGFDHKLVALSAGIQKMIRSDLASSGVMFTLDTESGFRDAVFITSAYGLGETVVQGAVNPDEFYVFKPNIEAKKSAILRRSLGSKMIKMTYDTSGKALVKTVNVSASDRNKFSITDQEIETLARYAMIIEKHYGRPMDIEWAKDGLDGRLYIVQARPETVESRNNANIIERYHLNEKSEILITGRAIGQRIGAGTAKVIDSIEHMHEVEAGDVLVTDMTDPDWEPIMKKASAIVTNRGGRTCHAAIIARELGIPAVVGCHDATSVIQNGQSVTVSCAEGDEGHIYDSILDFEIIQKDSGNMPELPTKIMMNVGNPGRAFSFSQIPNAGVGLARVEFVINTTIGIHPRALLEYNQLDGDLQEEIDERTAGYASPVDFYVEKLTEGIATLGAAFAGKPVIVRMSDFKSNEYANLLGGDRYEPHEENPMIGFRGASRYVSDDFRQCFELECRAIRKAREEYGFTNIEIMIPFVRTLTEAKAVIALLAQNGLERGKDDLRLIMMCEIPSNAVLAEEFLELFDGFSIGSNDMTQLTLGLDRDSGLIAQSFDERNPAVKKMLTMAIDAAHKQGKYIGICGQGPSDYPDFAEWLFEKNISSISLNPDTVIDTWLYLGKER